MSITYFYVMLY